MANDAINIWPKAIAETEGNSVMDELYDDIDLDELRNQCGDKKIQDDVLICECNCISASEIRDMFKDNKNIDLEALQDKLGLGSGCGSCLKSKDSWMNEIL